MRSPEQAELFKALIAAQKDMRAAFKGSNNPHFKSRYADLNSLIDATREALNSNGLAVIQELISIDGIDYLVTTLLHCSGQYRSSQFKLSPQKNDIQSLGSFITYIRRYSYQSLLCLETSDKEDDDGESAMVRYIGERQQQELIKLIKSSENPKELYQQLLFCLDVKSIDVIKESQFQSALNIVKKE